MSVLEEYNGSHKHKRICSLSNLYKQQLDFQELVLLKVQAEQGEPSFSVPHDDVRWFSYHIQAMVEELGEIMKADKRWKTHRNEAFNQIEKVDEIADMFITAMNIAIYSGLSAEELHDCILSKILENTKKIGG